MVEEPHCVCDNQKAVVIALDKLISSQTVLAFPEQSSLLLKQGMRCVLHATWLAFYAYLKTWSLTNLSSPFLNWYTCLQLKEAHLHGNIHQYHQYWP